MKKTVKERLKRRKNYFPTMMLMIVFWLLWVSLVWWVDPTILKNLPPRESYWPFFLLFFLALFLTLSLILQNTRRGFLISFGILLFLILRLSGLGHVINGLLIGGIVIAIEVYFSLK